MVREGFSGLGETFVSEPGYDKVHRRPSYFSRIPQQSGRDVPGKEARLFSILDTIDPWWMTWVIIPVLIFLARLCDVSVGTIRIIMLNRGRRSIAPVLGFVEVLIWLIAIRQIFQHLDNAAAFLAYALGFAAGTMVGMSLENKLAIGNVAIRVITSEDARDLIDKLSESKFGVTSFAAEGVNGKVRLIFSIAARKQLGRALEIINELHPKAFISISDVRSVSEGVFPERPYRFGMIRKGR